MVNALFALAALLFIIWLIGLIGLHIVGLGWHLVLLIAIIVLVYNLLTRNRVV
jgi:hypothetical protein